jgi:hypothetical protein
MWSQVLTRPETKNYCAGEVKKKITALLRAVTGKFNPSPLFTEEAPFQNT